jgi:hypothetical protein
VRKSFVYGLEHCDPHKPLVLTVSFWAPLFFHEKGIQAAGLMGTEMTPEQERCLEPFKIIWIAFDADQKGIEATSRIADRLKRNHAAKTARFSFRPRAFDGGGGIFLSARLGVVPFIATFPTYAPPGGAGDGRGGPGGVLGGAHFRRVATTTQR